MRTHRYFLVLATYLAGCYGPEGIGPDSRMMNCVEDGGTPRDLASVMPCAASKGLSGDRLICVNFANMTSLDSLSDWTFNPGPGPGAWELAMTSSTPPKKVLRIASFANYMGDSGFKTPLITLTQLSSYTRLIFSIQHSVDLNPQIQSGGASPQLAQILLNDLNKTILNQTTGKNQPQQSTLVLEKMNLPQQPAGGYQFNVNLHAPYQAGGANKGWEIDSIAIYGSKD